MGERIVDKDSRFRKMHENRSKTNEIVRIRKDGNCEVNEPKSPTRKTLCIFLFLFIFNDGICVTVFLCFRDSDLFLINIYIYLLIYCQTYIIMNIKYLLTKTFS